MKTTIIATCSALFFVGATTANAQSAGFQGFDVTLSYGSLSAEAVPDTTLSSTLLKFDGAYNFTPSFGAQVGLGFEQLSLKTSLTSPDLTVDLNTVVLDAHAYYNISADAKAGVFVAKRDLNSIGIISGAMSGSIPTDISLLTYGAEASGKFGQFSVGGYAGVADILIGGSTTGLDINTVVYGIDVAYDINAQISVNGKVNVTDTSLFGFDANLMTYVVGAEYAFNDNLTVMANLQGGSLNAEGTEVANLFGYGVGVDYVLPVTVAGDGDLTIFGRVGTTNLSVDFASISEDIVNYQIGATWSFGGGKSDSFFEVPSLF